MVPHSEVTRKTLLSLYFLQDAHFGKLHWWPGDSPLEIIVGAILTQNTSWKNVEAAIINLKAAKILTAAKLYHADERLLETLIVPSGYYRQKTKKIKAFLTYLYKKHGGNINKMLATPLVQLREELLVIWGIGKETADSIILYAAEKPLFVVDAYTTRILSRHGFCKPDASYDAVQKLFLSHLEPSVELFKQYHALIVNTGKTFCKTTPLCEACPLQGLNDNPLLRQETLARRSNRSVATHFPSLKKKSVSSL